MDTENRLVVAKGDGRVCVGEVDEGGKKKEKNCLKRRSITFYTRSFRLP